MITLIISIVSCLHMGRSYHHSNAHRSPGLCGKDRELNGLGCVAWKVKWKVVGRQRRRSQVEVVGAAQHHAFNLTRVHLA